MEACNKWKRKQVIDVKKQTENSLHIANLKEIQKKYI